MDDRRRYEKPNPEPFQATPRAEPLDGLLGRLQLSPEEAAAVNAPGRAVLIDRVALKPEACRIVLDEAAGTMEYMGEKYQLASLARICECDLQAIVDCIRTIQNAGPESEEMREFIGAIHQYNLALAEAGKAKLPKRKGSGWLDAVKLRSEARRRGRGAPRIDRDGSGEDSRPSQNGDGKSPRNRCNAKTKKLLLKGSFMTGPEWLNHLVTVLRNCRLRLGLIRPSDRLILAFAERPKGVFALDGAQVIEDTTLAPGSFEVYLALTGRTGIPSGMVVCPVCGGSVEDGQCENCGDIKLALGEAVISKIIERRLVFQEKGLVCWATEAREVLGELVGELLTREGLENCRAKERSEFDAARS